MIKFILCILLSRLKFTFDVLGKLCSRVAKTFTYTVGEVK